MTLRVSGAGGNHFYTWLADVDANGNVPFPWGQREKGTTYFAVSAGGVVVNFEHTFV
ncbi:MAG TPA: hypothetical protein VFW12_04370 [Candidatus Limnocylindria bacterium]|nr:hypothetical protein [Candidatus Limnocylindria bacterium]